MNYFHDPNSRFHREFEELQMLGAGGFGSVFKVRNKLDECIYAMKKVIFMHKGFRNPYHDIVIREVRSLAQLNHTNVMRYYGAWIEPLLSRPRNVNFTQIKTKTIVTNNTIETPTNNINDNTLLNAENGDDETDFTSDNNNYNSIHLKVYFYFYFFFVDLRGFFVSF